jgi:glycerophosphoryl diester phosphodiesterase
MNRLPSRPLAAQGGAIVLAHRGWRGRFPENTLLAMEKAAEMPIDGLELDVRMSKDGVIMVFHDESLPRTTNGRGLLHEKTLDQLQQLDAGCKWSADDGASYPFAGQGVRIPTLEQVFQRFPDLWINIDIKQHDPETVRAFAQLVRRYGREKHICVGSFDLATNRRIRQLMPDVAHVASKQEVRRLLILSKLYLGFLFRPSHLLFQVPEVDPASNIRVVSERFSTAAHRRQGAVHVWTVNEMAEMQRLLEMGVDGLITDFPDRALRLLGRI